MPLDHNLQNLPYPSDDDRATLDDHHSVMMTPRKLSSQGHLIYMGIALQL